MDHKIGGYFSSSTKQLKINGIIIDNHTIEYPYDVSLQAMGTNVVSSVEHNVTRLKFTESSDQLIITETIQNGITTIIVKPKNQNDLNLCSNVAGSKSNGSIKAIAINSKCTPEQLAAIMQ
jgi:hypothetical protein